MHIRRFVVPAFVVALYATATISGSIAVEASPPKAKASTAQTPSPGVAPKSTKMSPYAAKLASIILAEVRQTRESLLWWTLVELSNKGTAVALFVIDRNGKMIEIKLAQKSNSLLVDNFVLKAVKAASRNFPPPPANLSGAALHFYIPVTFR